MIKPGTDILICTTLHKLNKNGWSLSIPDTWQSLAKLRHSTWRLPFWAFGFGLGGLKLIVSAVLQTVALWIVQLN